MNPPQRFNITTPIYYVNAEPHIGNAYTTIAADILNRFYRLFGYESFFLTGTDEHGSKVAESAQKAGLEPQQFCDINSGKFKDSWKQLEIEYDQFVRTTDRAHTVAVQKFLQQLYDRGHIYKGEYVGQYCTGCEKFLTDKDLNADGLCAVHLTPPQELREKNYFFRLSEFLEPLRKKIESNELVILPETRRREVLGLFKQNLEDFSVSRERVKWGIELPFDRAQVTYVWIDALINYISAAGYPDGADFQKRWNDSFVVHLMAKDILKFHCIFWPALLMAADVKLPDRIMIHGYLILDSKKMSKSLGNIITPKDMIGWFGVDATRYLTLNMFPFGADGDVRIEDFYTKYNSDLANNYGNLVSRVFKIVERDLHGEVGSAPTGSEIVTAAAAVAGRVRQALTEFGIKAAADEIIAYLNRLNAYFDESKPWVLAKEAKLEKLREVCANTVHGIAVASALLTPFLPQKAGIALQAILGGGGSAAAVLAGLDSALKPSAHLAAPKEQLFPRLEMPKTLQAEIAPVSPAGDNLISIDDFGRVELKIAVVVAAERVPKADKLLKLQIKIGDEPRQIVAGIAQQYAPEQLLGRKIVVVTNLQPAKLRGIESQGMLLAAKHGDRLALLTVDSDLPSGATIS